MNPSGEIPSEEGHWTVPQTVQESSECRHPIQRPIPHPSQTHPSIPCAEYYPYYCKSMSRPDEIHCGVEEPGLMVHLNKNGGIQVQKGKKRKDFEWNRPPPLTQPISNSVPDFVRGNVWDPRYATQSLQHQ